MILGITGKYCSGKNLVTDFVVKEGWHEIDMDKLGHQVLKQNKAEVAALFGKEILDGGGEVDRERLGEIVFGSKKELHRLEAVIHPKMVSLCRMIIEDRKSEDLVINAAILHKMGLNRLCDSILWVKAPFLDRFRRALKRDSYSFLQIIRRMAAQRSLDAKYYREDVDSYTIWNKSSIDDLESEIKRHLAVLGVRK